MSDRLVPRRKLTLLLAWLAAFAPPSKELPADWVEQNIVLPAESSALSGQLRLFTYQRAMLNAPAEPGVETVVYQISVQTGKSTVLDGALAYYIVNDPGPALLVHPTDKQGTKYVQDRLKPMIKATPALKARINGGKGGADFTGEYIRYPGGNLRVASAYKPDDLRSRANKVLLLDEVDAYPKSAGGKGEPCKLAMDRGITYRGKGGITLIASTPAEKDGSRIEQHLHRGDLRRFFVKFECCGADDYLDFDRMLKWDAGKPETAHLVCPHCGGVHDEPARRRMIAAGDWRKTQQGKKGVVSFHAGILISEVPSISLAWIAQQAEGAKTVAERMAFRNSLLAETFSPEAEQQLDAERLYERRVQIEPPYPSEIQYVTCGVDVQGNRLEVVWLGIGKAGLVWFLDHNRIMGDTSAPAGTGVWLELDAAFARTFPLKDGTILAPSAYAVDSGYLQDNVAAFVVLQRRKQRNALATKGAKAWDARAIQMGAKLLGVTQQVQVGTVGIKKTILAHLAMPEFGPGWIHLPAHLEFEVIEQLTSELIITDYVRGQPRDHVQQVISIRNDVLDAFTYAYAMTHIPGITRRVISVASTAPQKQPSTSEMMLAMNANLNGGQAS